MDFSDLFAKSDELANRAVNARMAALRRDQAMNSLGIMTGDSALAAEGKTMAPLTETQMKIVSAVPGFRLTEALKRQQAAEVERANRAGEGNAAAVLGVHQRQAGETARHNKAMEQQAQAALEAENWAHVAPTATNPGYLYNRKSGETRPLSGIPGMEFDPKNAGAKLTEAQLKTFEAANRVLDNLGVIETGGPTGLMGRKDLAASGLAGGPAAWVTPHEAASEGGKLYFDAARNVVGGLLRKESGAAINADEWNNLGPNYVPMPWDTAESKQAKLMRLRSTLNALIVQAGPGGEYLRRRAISLYGPGIFDEPGAVPTGTAGGGSAPAIAPVPAQAAATNPRSGGAALPSNPRGLNYGKFGYAPGGKP